MNSSNEPGLPAVLSVLDRLTEEDLAQLNRIIVARLRLMHDIRSHQHMMNLRVGQRVEFTTTAGRQLRGTITRHNRKSVSIVTDEGVQWRVAPEFLKQA